MPKKTKKQKIRASEKKPLLHSVDHTNPQQEVVKQTVSEQAKEQKALHSQPVTSSYEHRNKEQDTINTSYFLGDLKKTLIAIAVILCIEGGLYALLSTNTFSIQSYLPF